MKKIADASHQRSLLEFKKVTVCLYANIHTNRECAGVVNRKAGFTIAIEGFCFAVTVAKSSRLGILNSRIKHNA